MSRLLAASYESNWSSVVGSLAGVLRALGTDRPAAHVSALSGHAFRLAITSGPDGEIGADGPNHFSAGSALEQYQNLGWRFEAIEAGAGTTGFEARRREALNRLRRSIDHGRPALAFGLHLPEFGIVRGYDGDDLIAATTVSAQYGERIPATQWPSPARPQPLRVFIPEKRVKTDQKAAIGRMLRFAIGFALAGDVSPVAGMPAAPTGLAAFEHWARLLDGDAAISPHGQALCIQALQSARHDAATFLSDLAPVYQGGSNALMEAVSAYNVVVLELSRMASLFPYPNGGDVVSAGSRRAGAAYVRRAGAAEAEAVRLLSASAAERW